MNTEKAAQKLGMEKGFLESAIKRRIFSHESYEGIEYFRLRHKARHLEKGTIYFPGTDELIRGFPKIRRILCLKTAIEKHLKEFSAEEKMDGYNVRIARIGDRILAITRGGIICPYSTCHSNTPECQGFFKDNPDKVLCAEFAGPLNPHVVHDYEGVDSIDFFVFDIRDKNTNRPVPVKERVEMLDNYGLKKARFFGIFTPKDHEKIRQIIEELENQGGEGLVLKDTQMRIQLKYTTPNSTRGDLRYAFKFPFDFGREFMFRRILREGFMLSETNATQEELKERARLLGESILIPLVETISKVSRGEPVTEENTIVDDGSANQLLKSLEASGIKFDTERTGDKIKIKRHPRKTHDKVDSYLRGEFCGE